MVFTQPGERFVADQAGYQEKVEADQRQIFDVVSQTVDEALVVLGVLVRDHFYLVLERKYSLKRDQVAVRPEVLLKALEIEFGPKPALILERIIAKKLSNRLGLREHGGEPNSLRQAIDYAYAMLGLPWSERFILM